MDVVNCGVSLMYENKCNPQLEQLDFRLLFESAPGLYLVLRTDLSIAAVSNEYLQATMTKREDILGRNIFEVLPDNPDDPEATGVRNLRASLECVIKYLAPHTMAVQRYDVRRPDGAFELRYWSPINSPVLGPDGKLAYIIHRVEDVTDFVRLKQQGLKQTKLTQELRARSESMEAEIFVRTQQIEERNKELNRMIQALHKSRDEAIESSNLKAAFISTISHELRTPLTGLLGFIELLTITDLSPEQTELAETALQSAHALLEIVNDLLDFSKMEAGKIELERVSYQPADVVEETCNMLAAAAMKKHLSIHLDLRDGENTLMIGDPLRLRQVLTNLVGNSIKFTESGRINVRISREAQERIRFIVEDTGIGIAEENHHFLFLPFSQLDSSNTRRFGGTGLGLAICKRLVEMMQGEIGFTSELGKGSTFWFSLPVQLCPALPEPLSTTFALRSSQSEPNILAHTRRKVALIVEDSPVVQTVVIKQLLDIGIRAHAVSNGKAALETLRALHFDAILMDCQMPELDGFQTTELIRQGEKGSNEHIPIIAMTAGSMTSDEEQRFVDCGMDDYLVKPFSSGELKNKIQQWLPEGLEDASP